MFLCFENMFSCIFSIWCSLLPPIIIMQWMKFNVRNTHPPYHIVFFFPTRFSGLLGRRSKSPRRPERSDRLERLDRPVKPVRESSLRGREREPAEPRRGRFLERPGQQVRERHRFKRERQLRGEGWEERERPTGKVRDAPTG